MQLGILGAGHLGKIHMSCALNSGVWDVAGFYDPNDDNAATAIKKFGLRRFDHLDDLLAACDAVDIVTPTITHYELATRALLAGCHLFIEKPVTHTVEEGQKLLEMAENTGLTVQVGHVERFNPAFQAVQKEHLTPMFIEAHRLSVFQARGTDVSVVLDLMIHDLDLILHLVKSEVKTLSAGGVAVLSKTPDIANARIEFENGCIANLTASRISLKQMRKMRLFQQDTYISLDFLEKQTQMIRLFDQQDQNLPPLDQLMEFETQEGKKWLQLQMPEAQSVNAIEEELRSFATAIREKTPPPVTLNDGYRALRLAHQILAEIEYRLQQQSL